MINIITILLLLIRLSIRCLIKWMTDMLSVKGVFDGEVVRPLEKLNFINKRNVIITFIDDGTDDEMNDIRDMSLNPSGFDFWNDKEEDLYGEYLNEK